MNLAFPRIVLGTDGGGWCWDNHARQLAPLLGSHCDVRVVAKPDAEPSADLCFCYSWADLRSYRKHCAAKRYVVHVAGAVGDEWDVRQALLLADAITVVSPFVARDVARLLPVLHPPIYICRTGIDLDLFGLQPFPEEFTVGWAGRSTGNKGVEIIAEACTYLGIPFVVQDARVEKLPYERMPEEFYRRISVYACASASEGTPEPVQEALACGRPVVSTDVGLVRELVRNDGESAGWVVAERTGRAFARVFDSLRREMKSRTLKMNAPTRAQSCRARVQHLAWPRAAQAWKLTFEHVLRETL